MRNGLNPDNSVMTFMSKACDMLIINLVWLFLCIPVITIVPATTAMYYAVVKVIRRERGYMWKEFFRSFRSNLRQGCICSLIAALLAGILYLDFQLVQEMMQRGDSTGDLLISGYLVVFFLLLVSHVYLCPVLSRFKLKLSGLYRMSFLLAFRHFPTTMVLLLLQVAVFAVLYVFPNGMFFLPILGILLASFLIERVLKKYMPTKEEAEAAAAEDTEVDLWYLE